MIKFFTKRMNNRKGFTLIELIVVIAILGILAALAIPRFTGTQDRARERAHDANVATLTSAANLALAEHGNPTSGVVDWEENDAVDADGDYSWSHYIDVWPQDPFDRDYKVEISTAGVVTVSPAAGVYP